MSLKAQKPIRNEAKKCLKTEKLHVNEGEEAKKYLKTNELASQSAADYARFARKDAQIGLKWSKNNAFC